MHQSSEEILPIVNENGKVIGKAPREKFHFQENEKLLHPVVHLHLLNSRGQLFLQYRPAFKKVQPEKWDTAVGGHVSFNENIWQALARESEEEIGLSPEGAEKLITYTWETNIERELVYLYVFRTNKLPEINAEELAGGRFWDIPEIEKSLDAEIFTPNFIHEFKLLRRLGIL